MTDERQYQYELETERRRDELTAEAEETGGQAKQARMGWGIFLIGLLLGLIADAAELITAGTLGWFIGAFVDLILLAMLGISKAGRSQWKRWIWGPAIETVPVLATIPFFRAGFLIWSFLASRSEKLQTVSKAASLGLSKK